MKKIFMCSVIFIFLLPLFSQEKQDIFLFYSGGLLIEANMNTPEYYSFGSGVHFLFGLPDFAKKGKCSLGLKTLYSYNPDKYYLFNSALLFRWSYDFTRKKPHSGIFLQPALGFSLAWNNQNKINKPFSFILAEFEVGYHYSYKNFFIEPYIYMGYPVL